LGLATAPGYPVCHLEGQMKNYCIREDYVPRTEAVTYVDNPANYWNKKRIAASGFCQYYVYKIAAELAGQMDHCSFVDIGCGYPIKIKELIFPVTSDITLIDQPSMKGLMEERFPEMRFIPLNLERMDISLQAKFNCIVCADVIEHLLDPDPLLAFIRSALAPEGIAIISTPERDIERGSNCLRSPKAEHVREWNTAEFTEYLSLIGLEVIEHSLMPKGKLPWIEEIALPLTRLLKTKRYSGCQTAVCKLK
jgi:SAM-dependent methyltransferase